PRRIIPCEADMTILSLSKVNTEDVATATRSIADALQGYGTIRDILFQGGKRVFSQTVMVLFKRNSGVTLPSHILIEGRHIHLAGRHVEPSCTYCKKEGHFIGKCPRLARLKKRATTVEAKSGPAKKPNQSTSETSASASASAQFPAAASAPAPASTSAPRANSTRTPVSTSAKGKQSQAQITSDPETPPAKPLKRARRTATVSIADLVYTDKATPLALTKPHPEEAKNASKETAENKPSDTKKPKNHQSDLGTVFSANNTSFIKALISNRDPLPGQSNQEQQPQTLQPQTCQEDQQKPAQLLMQRPQEQQQKQHEQRPQQHEQRPQQHEQRPQQHEQRPQQHQPRQKPLNQVEPLLITPSQIAEPGEIDWDLQRIHSSSPPASPTPVKVAAAQLVEAESGRQQLSITELDAVEGGPAVSHF
ncbi:hypothetical protein GGI26_006517, partial [Coemansia sp. RSA 1358]